MGVTGGQERCLCTYCVVYAIHMSAIPRIRSLFEASVKRVMADKVEKHLFLYFVGTLPTPPLPQDKPMVSRSQGVNSYFPRYKPYI